MAETFHPDDALNRSPTPPRTRVDYRVINSPPPHIPSPPRPSSPQEEPSGPSSKSPIHRQENHPSSLAGAALLTAIEPSRPDIARWELEFGSREQEIAAPIGKEGNDIKGNTAAIAQDALIFLQRVKPTPGSPPSPRRSPVKEKQSPGGVDLSTPRTTKGASRIPGESVQQVDNDQFEKGGQQPSPRATGHPHPHLESTSANSTSQNQPSATSPNLKEFKISHSDRPAAEALPRMQPLSPSASSNPNDSSQTLPSLQSTVGTQLKPTPMKDQASVVNGAHHSYTPAPVSSPSHKPPTSIKQETQPPGSDLPAQNPSGYSQTSPPSSIGMSSRSPPSGPGGNHPSYWRAPPKSESPYVTSPFDPGSSGSQMGTSPSTAYPTPTDHLTPNEADRANTTNSPLQPNGPLTSSGFKCTHPDCSAPPFQTQYLLNSHANVHSAVRPHFCPVSGCPRGVGGKGFKRKNEMIRHGLVHDSPGYVCPFCPEQQHRYPRPDNLQRHVRVHHVDKDKDDPQLRHVLSQRPEGGSRGRRRRVDS